MLGACLWYNRSAHSRPIHTTSPSLAPRIRAPRPLPGHRDPYCRCQKEQQPISYQGIRRPVRSFSHPAINKARVEGTSLPLLTPLPQTPSSYAKTKAQQFLRSLFPHTRSTRRTNMADLQGRKVFKVFNQDFVVDERYNVTKELGQGAYGIVW